MDQIPDSRCRDMPRTAKIPALLVVVGSCRIEFGWGPIETRSSLKLECLTSDAIANLCPLIIHQLMPSSLQVWYWQVTLAPISSTLNRILMLGLVHRKVMGLKVSSCLSPWSIKGGVSNCASCEAFSAWPRSALYWIFGDLPRLVSRMESIEVLSA